MTTTNTLPAAGWYPHPSGNGGQAYWTGKSWDQPPKPPKKSHRWLVIVLGVFVALVMIGKATGAQSKSASTEKAEPVGQVQVSGTVTRTFAPTTPARAQSPAPAPAAFPRSFTQCQDAPANLVENIDFFFAGDGRHLINSAAIGQQGDEFIFVGGDIAGPDGQVQARQETWIFVWQDDLSG